MDREINESWASLPIHLTTMMHAESMLGVTEDYVNGRWTNWGEQIKEFLFAANLSEPAPWCAAFINWCAEQGAYDHGAVSSLEQVPLQAYVQSYADWATENDSYLTPAEAGPGDIFILYYDSLQRYAHIGFVKEVNEQEGWFTTIEGNTNDNASREGFKVASRRRNLTQNTKFIRWV